MGNRNRNRKQDFEVVSISILTLLLQVWIHQRGDVQVQGKYKTITHSDPGNTFIFFFVGTVTCKVMLYIVVYVVSSILLFGVYRRS